MQRVQNQQKAIAKTMLIPAKFQNQIYRKKEQTLLCLALPAPADKQSYRYQQ
jgi:hypothetical protein